MLLATPQRAALMYELALAFNPTCAEAHNNLGVIFKEQVGNGRKACNGTVAHAVVAPGLIPAPTR